jgi:hypothetical protein
MVRLTFETPLARITRVHFHPKAPRIQCTGCSAPRRSASRSGTGTGSRRSGRSAPRRGDVRSRNGRSVNEGMGLYTIFGPFRVRVHHDYQLSEIFSSRHWSVSSTVGYCRNAFIPNSSLHFRSGRKRDCIDGTIYNGGTPAGVNRVTPAVLFRVGNLCNSLPERTCGVRFWPPILGFLSRRGARQGRPEPRPTRHACQVSGISQRLGRVVGAPSRRLRRSDAMRLA